jgi:hypothetical protein
VLAEQDLRPTKARIWARRGATPAVAVSGKAWAGCPWRGWSASGPMRGAACSTGCVSTADARASAAACPKPITLA